MTVLILAVLLCAWAGYFAYCLKDRKFMISQRRDGTAAFNRSLGALGDSVVGAGQRSRSSHAFKPGGKPLGHAAMAGGLGSGQLSGDVRTARPGVLLDLPRTPHEASRRRRHVTVILAAAALVSLVAAVGFGTGPAGWFVHVLFDAALVGFVGIAAHLKHRSAEYEMRAMLLHHGRPAQQHGSAPSQRGVPVQKTAERQSQAAVGRDSDVVAHAAAADTLAAAHDRSGAAYGHRPPLAAAAFS